MEDQLKTKIKAELKRGIKSESQVVYFLVEIRKLLDKSKHAIPYNSLRLYSNWVVHVELTHAQAQNIVRKADVLYPKLIAGTLNNADKADFSRIFSLDIFREELSQFLNDKGLGSFSEPAWNTFVACFLNVIEDCPLACKAKEEGLAYVDEVIVLRHDRALDGSPQHVIWALCHKGKFKMSVGGLDPLPSEVINAIDAFIEARND